jgi:hydrogenase nickel incorporation protein HypA/HybF
MHEVSIAEELANVIRNELRVHPEARVTTAYVRVGALRLIEPVMLEFCFEVLTRNTPLAGARLCIERVEAAARCRKCSLEFAVEDKWFECPRCGEGDGDLVRGDDLLLVGLDIEANPSRTNEAPLESFVTTCQAPPIAEENPRHG